MEYGLIGMPLEHSFSAEIHESLGWYHYELYPLDAQEFAAFMRARNFRGINVTIPYKQDVIAYLDEIEPMAANIGAVNCVVNRAGKLYGYNTDLAGMQALVRKMNLNLSGKNVLICGTGGTSKTARAMARAAEAASVLRLSRTKKDGSDSARTAGANADDAKAVCTNTASANYADVITYAQAYNNHTNAHILINTTPCGMFPNNSEQAINAAAFPQLQGIVDAVYNPLETPLVQQGHHLGVPAEGGLYMLVAQAVIAAHHFMNTAGDANLQQTCDHIFSQLERKKRNIVLVGMPGCGKTTVGTCLAKNLGRTLYDTDQIICEISGKTPGQIITTAGEEAFRAIESEAVALAGKNTGCVIATGGGAILRPENSAALQQNGLLYFIDRPLEQLLPTHDRPLANSAEKLVQLYDERYPRYAACADFTIPVNGSAAQVAQRIQERHFHEDFGY